MPRLEIELTSKTSDGQWTWRAAGARQPKGLVPADVVGDGASVGDVLRAETEMGLDGISIVSVASPKTKRPDPTRIEVIGPPPRPPERPADHARPRRPPAGAKGESGRRRTEAESRRPSRRATPGASAPSGGETRRRGPAGGSERAAGNRSRPRERRLQPGRVHRDALLSKLPAEQVPVAEQLMKGGLPAVRKAAAEQNSQAREAGVGEVNEDALVTMAEQLLPALRAAEWRDRADAVMADSENVSLRDLRSVVAGAESIARDPDSRERLAALRAKLEERAGAERKVWEAEIAACLDDGRVLRALRLSARSPEPGAKFPAETASRLAGAAGSAMTAEVPPDRWAALLDAVVASPVRRVVKPEALPPEVPRELMSSALQAVGRVPGLAPLVGTTVPAPPPPPSKRPPSAGPAPSRAGSGDDGDDPVLVEELR